MTTYSCYSQKVPAENAKSRLSQQARTLLSILRP